MGCRWVEYVGGPLDGARDYTNQIFDIIDAPPIPGDEEQVKHQYYLAERNEKLYYVLEGRDPPN